MNDVINEFLILCDDRIKNIEEHQRIIGLNNKTGKKYINLLERKNNLHSIKNKIKSEFLKK